MHARFIPFRCAVNKVKQPKFGSGVAIVNCDAGIPEQLWHYNVTSGHLLSTATGLCLQAGKQVVKPPWFVSSSGLHRVGDSHEPNSTKRRNGNTVPEEAYPGGGCGWAMTRVAAAKVVQNLYRYRILASGVIQDDVSFGQLMHEINLDVVGDRDGSCFTHSPVVMDAYAAEVGGLPKCTKLELQVRSMYCERLYCSEVSCAVLCY
jgi:hypothetical protein